MHNIMIIIIYASNMSEWMLQKSWWSFASKQKFYIKMTDLSFIFNNKRTMQYSIQAVFLEAEP